jgi:hypothetical protein
LKYIPTAYFLLPLEKLLLLTNGPKNRRRMAGQRILCIFFVFSSTLATDGLGSALFISAVKDIPPLCISSIFDLL